ncbi:MAG TPA: FKBP-type peptidyl-prolyl cis-trans isomerase [Aeromicrobium sp.]|nr:FKBP-type peptidyl-prolyl cis-trans isomerase [Aeromicrobium sp.]HKY56782.1 FKBP-type peptidyl-prolyl cis-trans isomerase [Aeromicrobium sp.]
MRRIPLSKSTALVLTFALVVTGCSGGSPLDELSVGGTAKAPKVTVPEDFSVDETTTKVVKQGTGAKLASGDLAKVAFVAYNGRTGKQFDTSYGGRTPLTVELTKDKSLAGFVKVLKGQRVGSQLLAAIPPIDGFGTARPEVGLNQSDTMVFYLDILAKVGTVATGKKQALPADVPVPIVKEGHPTGFTKTATTPATLTESSAHIAVKGSGAKVPKGGTVVAHYLGQVFPQGAVFDTSWDRGAPATFPLGSVIKCWQNLLPGVPVGSRVVLQCTAEEAYGDTPQPGSKIKPGDALLFVVDVLDAY